MEHHYTLLIHGGAGDVPTLAPYEASLRAVMSAGEKLLASGAPALEVVEQCVILLENDPMYNAGKGSVFNAEKKIECDAAIMNGLDMKAGAIAGVHNVKNPISLARLVMEASEHVFLVGEGAMKFAELQKVAMESNAYFETEKRLKQWEEAQKRDKIVLDHTDFTQQAEKKFGTVGAVARDKQGNLAAATSTGGITNKKWGRVGDSPVIGAGVYADNETAAISATGYGEQFIRTVLAKTISDIIWYEKCSAQEAAEKGMAYLTRKVQGLGGVIVVDKEGNAGAGMTSKGMIYARIRESESIYIPGIDRIEV